MAHARADAEEQLERVDDEAPTGERFIPEAMGDQLIEAEHHARYRHAAQLVGGRAVLDAGCGVGWGSALLAAAGAARVVGLDVDDGALKDADARCSPARFVQGDLQRLPFADGSFDVVVCYEAIEHVEDPFCALDELRRVLAPGGVLTVSSPNPGIYPAGNPFHIHEFVPEELRGALGERFVHVTGWQQHPMMASALVRDDELDARSAAVSTLVELSMQSAMYSVFDASDSPTPSPAPVVTLVSARQFAGLVELLEELQARLDAATATVVHDDQADLVRLLGAERDHYRSQLDRVLLLLLDAEQELARRQDPSET